LSSAGRTRKRASGIVKRCRPRRSAARKGGRTAKPNAGSEGCGNRPAAGRADRVPAGAFGFRPGLTLPTGKRRARALGELKEVETGRFRPSRIRTGLDEGLRFLVQVRRLEGSGFASIVKVRETGCGRISVLLRSGGRERGLLRLELRRVDVRRACPRADDLAAIGRRFASGRCRKRAGCWSVRASAQGPAARKRSLLRAGAAKDRGRGVRFSCEIRQRKDRGSPRAQAANGSRRGACFPLRSGGGRIGACFGSRLRTGRDGEFASHRRPGGRKDRGSLRFRGSRRGCGKIVRFAFRLRRVLAERRSGFPGSADCEGTRSREAQSFRAGARRRGAGVRVRFEPTEGDKERPRPFGGPWGRRDGCFGAPRANLFEAARGESCCDASETGNGHPGLGLARTRREPPRPHGLDGTHGDRTAALATERCPPTQRVIASPRRGIVRLGHWGLAATPAPILVFGGELGPCLFRERISGARRILRPSRELGC